MGVEGAYYSKYLDKMRIKGQIGIVPYEVGFKVHSSWDIGNDSTSIIFFQTIGQVVRLIDAYENSNQGLEHYVKIINQKPWAGMYGKHFGPHDLRVKEWANSMGMTRVEKARQLGVNFTIVPDLTIEDGIESVRSAFSKIWIDEKNCAGLIKSLENYRREYDSKRQTYKEIPLHNWASHYADSMRYLAISLPKTRDGLSPDDLDKLYQDTILGQNARLPSIFRDDLPPY
jgi:phage terminase large subunit